MWKYWVFERVIDIDNFVKELDELLSKYEITIYEAQKLYLDNHKKSRRLTQCYEDSNNIWCYYDGDENNPCGCGSNCYHYEYDLIDKKIYGVCNACGTDIYEVKEEYTDERLHTGQWLCRWKAKFIGKIIYRLLRQIVLAGYESVTTISFE